MKKEQAPEGPRRPDQSDSTTHEPESHFAVSPIGVEKPLLGACLVSVGLIAIGGGLLGLARLITDSPSRATGTEYIGVVTALTGVLAVFHQLRLLRRATAEQAKDHQLGENL